MNKIPKEGNAESIFLRLQEFIEPIDSEWSKRVKPASEESISKLYEMLEMKNECFKLPKSFTEFVKYAGESDGGLLSNSLCGEFSISRIMYKVNNKHINPFCFIFLCDEVDTEYSFKLCKDKEQKIFTDNDKEVCSDFERLIFQCAVDLYESGYYKYEVEFGSSINSFSQSYLGLNKIDLFVFIDQLCKEFGLHKVWLSDEFYYFAYSYDFSIVFNRRNGICGSILSEKKELIEIFKEEFTNKIGAIYY